MKSSQFKTGLALILLVSSFILIPVSAGAALNQTDFIVENLQVHDIPYDDGSGLMLSWKPLPKERRIIEYRVYRGITPDSLFYIGRIDVNVKTGVPGDEMYFYDIDFNYFMDTQAPARLKREKQQPKGSPLYQRYPRDARITGPQLKHYDILGVISEKDYYYKNRRFEKPAEDDTTSYAGLKVRNFSQMAKKLIPDHEYYYTVLAVSESRKYYPHCEPVIGIPRENAPEKTKNLYPVFVQDLNRLQFEWSLPTFADDIYYHNIYLLNSQDLEIFYDYIRELQELEVNDIARKADSTLTALTPQYSNPARLIYRRYSGYPYTPSRTVSVDVTDNRIIGPKIYKNLFTGEETTVDVPFQADEIDNYYFVFSLYDAARYETFSDPVPAEVITSDQLPSMPEFEIQDRKDDKGDYNIVRWGKPVVYLTNSSYLNEKKTRLLINYEYNTNENYKIRSIYFRFSDEQGNELKLINEFYQDLKISLKIPENTVLLNVEMTFKCNNPLPEDYVIHQQLFLDEVTNSLLPGKVYLGNEDLKANEYYIYKRNYTDEEFRLSKKVAGTYRELEDNIRYENVHFKLVKEFDADKQLYLVSPSFSVIMDSIRENSIGSYLYRDLQEERLSGYEKSLLEYQTSLDTLITEAEIAEAESAVEYYQSQIDQIRNNPILQQAESFRSDKARIGYLDKVRHYAKNSFEYKIVKSNGKGYFSESTIHVREKPATHTPDNIYVAHLEGLGTDHFYPRSNWFKMQMLPALIASLIFGILVFVMIKKAKQGHDLYIRPIAGIQEIDNAIGRATEMGKPILFVPGLSSIGDVATLAGLAILSRVAKKAAEYDTRILVPVRDYIVLPIAQEIVKEAHYEAGRPDSYDRNSVFFITDAQFAFVAGVNGIMIREKTATNFYMGMFWAEALLMTETGSSTGAIQISGTDAVTQIPFFITTCDYTLIGEELYAASAYLAREPLQLGSLKAVDYFKLLILIFVISGTLLSTAHLTFLINSFPEK